MDIPFCTNCSGSQILQRVDGVFALTKVEKKEGGGVNFFPASGLPVVAFLCPQCGEIKLLPAKLFNEI
ncbi:MAG: hypothetical protein HYV41_00100 [Candidatus Magasanikbacteria bacterium]|nr:hypothetical protein [Candidatus Magasanikbacteria bacterium]